nr:hypothetical protein [Tanacetum cinerariifolium]
MALGRGIGVNRLTWGRSQAEFVSLFGEIGHMKIEDDGDLCIWSLSHYGGFSVSNVRRHIDDCMLLNLLSCASLHRAYGVQCPCLSSCDTTSIVWRLVRAWSDYEIPVLSSCEDIDS